ncbi:response regulator transcription factor [Alloscardovia omnicolens]|uniref:response regulator transcription factor n=1 Tax=Alloscardovia omnicolens TaxID=419015 RepID=UPI0006660AF7|nr:response regulator transcription factor [Alloscardovia omnicolens]MDK6249998.1 response regulator transcription factor [Alloscardovia omnicolens]MDK6328201.1 response regulator transcription factor [Alloscardovia omnicolens]MDK8074174.1 response regulator transcription factor [Alloscardovia omnicolens]MDK8082098.1 response regulator transcription factor [Alloscardovia omnicolens]MDU6533601.1 response regulator transcription factor [Alloscardovia omnicolens]
MSDFTLLTKSTDPASVLPALALLQHRVRVLPTEISSLVRIPDESIVFLDAREDVASAKTFCSMAAASGVQFPIIVILSEGGCLAFNAEWKAADFVVNTASPAEVETRARVLSMGGLVNPGLMRTSDTSDDEKNSSSASSRNGVITCGALEVDTIGYTATLHGHPLDLAYKEFELLKYLVLHPGRAFTRTHLLQEVWGYDYYGGTRTVDVHVRRLRAKLGVEFESVIGTVRNVGYRFDPPQGARSHEDEQDEE